MAVRQLCLLAVHFALRTAVMQLYLLEAPAAQRMAMVVKLLMLVSAVEAALRKMDGL